MKTQKIVLELNGKTFSSKAITLTKRFFYQLKEAELLPYINPYLLPQKLEVKLEITDDLDEDAFFVKIMPNTKFRKSFLEKIKNSKDALFLDGKLYFEIKLEKLGSYIRNIDITSVELSF